MARRRAVSSAYYALFHALCYVCADGLVGWRRSDQLEPIYRSVDHRTARATLNSRAVRGIDPALESFGITFALLQDLRHEADYSPPGHRSRSVQPFMQKEMLGLVKSARASAEIIGRLDSDRRRRLAILLLAKSRKAGSTGSRER
jgi:hypothetical protein